MPNSLKDVPGFAPHGGALEIRAAAPDETAALAEEASGLPTIQATSRRVLSDLELMAVGAVSPNRGFMTEADYRGVVDDMRLASGLPWSLPITLSATDAEAKNLKKGKRAAILHEGRAVAVIEVEDIFSYDASEEAEKTYRTSDDKHSRPCSCARRSPSAAGRRSLPFRPATQF